MSLDRSILENPLNEWSKNWNAVLAALNSLTAEECRKLLLNKKNPLGDTALHVAVEQNNVNVASELLSKGANPNAIGRVKERPLHRASQKASGEIIDLLLKNGASTKDTRLDNEKPLHLAARVGNVAAVKAFLEHDPKLITQPGKEGRTPLIVAALNNKLDVMEVLLSSEGCDPNGIDYQSNQSALHLAAEQTNLDMIDLLVKYKADINLQNGHGLTALEYCATLKEPNENVIDALIKHGAEKSTTMRNAPSSP